MNGDETDNSAPHSGAAYVFARNGTTWSQQAYLKASNTDAYDHFGGSVAVSGDTVVVGALFESSSATGVNGDGTDNSAPDAGAAYVFVRSGTTWSQQAYLKASNTDADDRFGQQVAVSGDTVVVGATKADVSGVSSAGAAYVFVRSGTTWSQQAHLKASNSDPLDEFGYSLALSGDTVVVGALWEASGATGVNGDQSDGSAKKSGAAYVFGLGPSPWTDLGFALAGTYGDPVLEGSGALLPGTPGALELSAARPNAAALLLISTANNPTPFLGGTLVPIPFVGPYVFVTDLFGTVALPWAAWPTGVTPGTRLYFQYVIDDPGALFGAALSNALEASVP